LFSYQDAAAGCDSSSTKDEGEEKKASSGLRDYVVVGIKEEAIDVKSFFLRPHGATTGGGGSGIKPLPMYQAGEGGKRICTVATFLLIINRHIIRDLKADQSSSRSSS